jgi:hypothetical protein
MGRDANLHALLYDQYQNHTKNAWHKCFAGGVSTARDKVTEEIIQADDLMAFAAN